MTDSVTVPQSSIDTYMIMCICTALFALCTMWYAWGQEAERDMIAHECNSSASAFRLRDHKGLYVCARVDLGR